MTAWTLESEELLEDGFVLTRISGAVLVQADADDARGGVFIREAVVERSTIAFILTGRYSGKRYSWDGKGWWATMPEAIEAAKTAMRAWDARWRLGAGTTSARRGT